MSDSEKKQRKKNKKAIQLVNQKLEEQLKRSYELRDFEIELYWKRAPRWRGFIIRAY
jgi:hypothetical protein